MGNSDRALSELLNIPLWETVQDQLALLTGTAIITIDFKGNPITKHSCRTDFCSVIRENPVFQKRCFRCDALAALEAVRLGQPYIYLCHCGIVDVAVPVMVGDRYLGAVMFGEVRLAKDDSEAKVERLINEISSFPEETGCCGVELNKKYQQLPEMSYSRIQQIAELIGAMVNYIVDRALKSQIERQTYDWLLRMSVNSMAQKDRGELTLQAAAGSAERSLTVPKSSAVYPAVAYISEHTVGEISLNHMADLCHLSPSYFSRLFHREVGESFTAFVNRQKVETAKKLLQDTAKSISQISHELGYLNTSHFINLFKRFEGITPLAYRQSKS